MGFNVQKATRGAGELVVIVVGVLIALAADRWIESQDARRMEAEYVAMLVQDLEADSAAFASQIEERKGRIEWSTGLAELLHDPSRMIADPERFLGELNYYAAWVPARVRQATWTELLSTGRLGLIRNPDLRRRLGQYYSAAESTWLGFDQMDRELAATKVAIERVLEPETRRSIMGLASHRDAQADAHAVLERIETDRSLRSAIVAAEERHRNIIRSSRQSVESAVSLLLTLREDAL